MALRLSEQRLRLVPAPPAPAGELTAPRDDDGRAGEQGASSSGQPPAGDAGDFYADAMETV